MTTTDSVRKFNALTERQKEVLRLVCKGLEYKDIGERLFLSKETIKAHMGNIYETLELTHLKQRSKRIAVIFEIYCPLLKQSQASPVIVEQEEMQEPEPVPPEVQKMVEEDEHALVLWESGQIIDAKVEEIPPRPRRGGGCLLGLLGIIVGLGLMAGYLYFFGGGIPGIGAPADSPAQQAEEPVQASPEMPEAPLASDTPVVVVVTATSIPASETPLPTATALPINTSVPPIATIAPSATPEADTPAGSILEVGDWWKEEGLWLRLEDYHLTTNIPSIRVFLELWNKTGDTILFKWVPSGNLSLRDNNGYKYPLNSYFVNISENEIYEPGELKYIRITNSGDFVTFQDDRLFDANVTELILTVSGVSRIDKAQFRIVLNK